MGHVVRAQAEKNAEERVLDALVGEKSTKETREKFRAKLRSGVLNDKEIEIGISFPKSSGLPTMDIPGMPGSQIGMINLGDVLGKSFSGITYGSIFTVAGLFHGWAYGQAIIGAESTPLLAYLLSFSLTQYFLAVSTIWLVRNVYKATKPSALHPRIIGALATGVGIAVFLENIENLILF